MTVLFLCAHGGAKSVMAASYFNRLAVKVGLPHAGVAAATEDPYDAVPEPVARLLLRDGHDVRAFTPRRVGQDEAGSAARVVAIGCELAGAPVERWDDVPAAGGDPEGAAAAIRRHVETLVEELRGRP